MLNKVRKKTADVAPAQCDLRCAASILSVCRVLPQVAIVTGAAKGIGYAIAQRLGKEGAAVMVSDVDDTAAATAVNNLKQQGISAAFTHCDVASSEQVRACTH